jgi:cyanate permease
MGVVSLGAGLFGYFGPQMLGILRDRTGSFAAGSYMVAIADVLTLGLIVLLYRITGGRMTRERITPQGKTAEGTT